MADAAAFEEVSPGEGEAGPEGVTTGSRSSGINAESGKRHELYHLIE